MRYAFVAAALASTVCAIPAFAQDVNPAFTGPRIAVIGGYDGIRPGSDEDSDIQGDDQTVDGFLYGGEIGYDIALSGFLVGAEAELSDSTGKVEANSNDPNFFGYGRVNTGRDIYVGARAGILATPNTLAYVKGGYTNARLDIQANDGTTNYDANFELDGFRLVRASNRRSAPTPLRRSNIGTRTIRAPISISTKAADLTISGSIPTGIRLWRA